MASSGLLSGTTPAMNSYPNISPLISVRIPRPLMILSAPSVGLGRGPLIPSRPQGSALVNRVAPMQPKYIRMRQPPQQQSLQYKSYTLKAQTKYSVLVSHVADGPLSFSLQLKESHPQLTLLMDKINKQSPKQVTAPISPNMMCIAKFAEDNLLCRALVLGISNHTCRVYYVDYGNSEDVPFKDVFALPDEFALPKVLSYKFVLSGHQGKTVTAEEKKIFKELVEGLEATVEVSELDGSSNKYVGDLFLNGKDVKVLMKKKVEKKIATVEYSTIPWPEDGTKTEVVITFVGQCGKFFVQDASHVQELHSTMDSVQKHCTEGTARPLKLEEKVVGMPCCAKYADGRWYRALILEFCGDNILILLVDFGNKETVQFSELLNITPKLVSQLEVRSLQCLLSGPSNNNARDRLLKLAGQFLTMEVITRTDDGLLVQLDSSGYGARDKRAPTSPTYQPCSQDDELPDTAVELPNLEIGDLNMRRSRRVVRFADERDCRSREKDKDRRSRSPRREGGLSVS